VQLSVSAYRPAKASTSTRYLYTEKHKYESAVQDQLDDTEDANDCFARTL
jgi:hypothetical protein